MNRDTYNPSGFMHHELQPPANPYQIYHNMQTNPNPAATFEVQAGTSCAEAEAPPLPSTSHQASHHTDRSKRSDPPFGDGYEAMSGCELPIASSSTASMAAPNSASRKRKSSSSYGTGSLYDDDGEDTRSTRTNPDKKQNHSEIEKRRRDKMNTYISELSAIIPMCGAMARKLDKLTVLRMAVQHLRSVRGALSACPLTARPRPAFISERELNALILQAAHDSFLIVVGCDRGRLLYVSASVKHMLHYEQSELLGQSMFDILHPKDVAKVKEQLSSSDISPRERLIDAKTMLPVKADMVAGASRLCPGARRSFFCRIKTKTVPESTEAPLKQEAEPPSKRRKKHSSEKKYCVVQCTGYLKSWVPAEMCNGAPCEGGEDGEAGSMSCLVAVGRALPDLAPSPSPPVPLPPTRRPQFVSRHAIDGKFLFVDQRVTLALGFLPQELHGTSLYEYISTQAEMGLVARTHKAALVRREPQFTPPFGFRCKDGSLVLLQTHFKPFRNPWTKDVECLVANNTVMSGTEDQTSNNETEPTFDVFKQKYDVEVQGIIDSQMESHKIGSAIAEEALRRSSSDFSPELPADLLQDAAAFNQASIMDNILNADMASYSVRNNVPLSAAGASSPVAEEEAAGDGAGGSSPTISPPLPLGLDGNGEAAMAVIMSLLEADAGLGGPVNFSGLPWPLP